jgi:hypothetical protein
MMKKDEVKRDTFALGLGGMNAVTGYYAMPAISHERLRQSQSAEASKSRQWDWRLWMPRRSRVV